jgi:hypothetical protein
MSSPFEQYANAVENSFNPGHNLVTELERYFSGTSFSSGKPPDEADLVDACMESARPTEEQKEKLHKLNARWQKLRARLSHGGPSESSKEPKMPKIDIAEKILEASRCPLPL